jgi:hypothetical protein
MGSKSLVNVLGIACIGITLSIGTTWVWADEQTKEQAGDVQERALPRMTVPGAAVSPNPQGAMIQGNQLKAAPGYVLEKGPKNQVAARKASGGGLGITKECKCDGGTGNCGVSSTDTIAVCSVSPSGPCSGTCKWGDPASKVGGTLQMR